MQIDLKKPFFYLSNQDHQQKVVSMEETNLCKFCRNVFSNPKVDWSSWTQHHTSYSDMLSSVATGCILCRWLSLQLPLLPADFLESKEFFKTCSDFKGLSYTSSAVCFKGECSWGPPFSIKGLFASLTILVSRAQINFWQSASEGKMQHPLMM